MKTVLKIAVLGGAFALTGCAGLNGKLEPKTFSMESENHMFEFQAETATGSPVTDRMILEGLKESMYEASAYTFMRKDERSEPSDSGEWQYIGVSPESDGLKLSYVNNKYYASMDINDTTRTDALYKVDISDSGDMKQVSIVTPSAIDFIPYEPKTSIGQNVRAALPIEKVKADVEQVNQMVPAIELTHDVKGSVDVDWPVESVTANFERRFGEEPSENDATVYRIGSGSQGWNVEIEVFPYRDGSKVDYQFEVPYELRGDGTSTYPADKVDGVIEKIEDTAND